MFYLGKFYSFHGSYGPQTVEEIRDLAHSFLETFLEMGELVKKAWYFDRDLNKVRERVYDLSIAWRSAENYHNDMIKTRNSVSNYAPIAAEFQRRLQRTLDLLTELESRITAVHLVRPQSYGCSKTLELVGKERQYITAIYELSKGLQGSEGQKPNRWVAEINKCIAKEHYAGDMDYTWRRFKDIILSSSIGVNDVESSHTPPSAAATSSNPPSVSRP